MRRTIITLWAFTIILIAPLQSFAQITDVVQTKNKTTTFLNNAVHSQKEKDVRPSKARSSVHKIKTNAIDESFESWPPTGWTLDPTSGDGTWVQDDGESHGPGATNIYDGFYAAMFSNYDYSDGISGSLITPEFDISSYSNPYLSFYWWNNDGSNSPAKIRIYTSTNGTNYTQIDEIETYGSGTTTWEHYSHTINSSDKYIKITGISDWGTKNTFVDKFEVYEGPTPPVFSIEPDSKDYGTLNLHDKSTQTFTITNRGGSTLTIDPAPTITGTNTADFLISDANTYPRDLVTNESITLDVIFSPQTEGSKSANLHIEDNTGTHDITLSGTGHDPTLTPPFTEDFSSYPPTDWSEGVGTLAAPSTITGTSSLWRADAYRNDNESSNGQAATIEIQQNNTNDWLFSPPINLGDGTTHYQLEFDLALTDWNNSGAPSSPPDNDDKFAVIISTDNGATWSSANALQIWDNTTNPKLSDIPSDGQHLVFDLTSYTDTVKIGFYGETTNTGSDFDLFVDNFYIREKPTTPYFSVSPENKNFGFQAIGTTSDKQTFTVTNTGGGTLTITGTSLSGTNTAEFVLTDNNTYPINLAGNQSMSVDVAFSPSTVGAKSASLDIVDTDTTHSLSLSGRGKNINHGGDGIIYGGYYYANSTNDGGEHPPTYNWIDPVASGHTEITSWTYTNIGVSDGDDSYFDATIPFTFTFFGNNYTHAYINSNGAIEFTEPNTVATGSNLSIPSSDAPNNFIAGCMMDLDDRSLGSVYYGTDNDGNFVVTWRHYHDLDDDTEYITFQIILKQNGNIKIQYNYDESALESSISNTTIKGDALIGIENSDGSDGQQYRNNGIDGPIFDESSSLALEYSINDENTPVELTSFNAVLKKDGIVKLTWTTATEVNTAVFDIEKKEDNHNGWEKIGTVEASGNSNSPKVYSYNDALDYFGVFEYRLKIIDVNGSFEYSNIVKITENSLLKNELKQNYPNPFNPTTTIAFSIKEKGIVKLDVYNSLGQKVAELLNKKMEAGRIKVKFDASNLTSGIYYYRINHGDFVSVKKMLFLK